WRSYVRTTSRLRPAIAGRIGAGAASLRSVTYRRMGRAMNDDIEGLTLRSASGVRLDLDTDTAVRFIETSGLEWLIVHDICFSTSGGFSVFPVQPDPSVEAV